MPRIKTRYYPDYGPLLPFAGPDWVWQRALHLVDHRKKASIGRDGADIIRAMRYLRAERARFRGRWRNHPIEDPEFHEALGISNSSRLYLLELQCRVLARESFGRIAVEMGLTRSVLRVYLKTFFDVDHRLDQRGYILNKVIKVAPTHPQNAYQLALQCAYSHGSAAVPVWMDWFAHMSEAHDLRTPEGRQREAIELLLLAHDLEVSSEQSIRLAQIEASNAEIGPMMFRMKSPREIIAENVATWLKGLSFDESRATSRESSFETKDTGRRFEPISEDSESENVATSGGFA